MYTYKYVRVWVRRNKSKLVGGGDRNGLKAGDVTGSGDAWNNSKKW